MGGGLFLCGEEEESLVLGGDPESLFVEREGGHEEEAVEELVAFGAPFGGKDEACFLCGRGEVE